MKYTVTGQCRIMGQEYAAVQEQEIVFPSPTCEVITS